ncbi:MAG: dihydrofolate reductase [Lachnospiraceae bacterium]|nr:dihydrofolate reductase [Lachnospiraceae bacterium]
MNLIASADENWGIGNKGSLLVRIPADMKNFSALTTGKVVVLGRKTLQTFPGGLPLKNRTNIILTRDPSYRVKDALIVHDLDELLEKLKEYDTSDVFIIGGSSVYNELLPYCDTAIITRIDYRYEADSRLPNLDEDPEWEITDTSEEQYYNDITYHFVTYKRKGR